MAIKYYFSWCAECRYNVKLLDFRASERTYQLLTQVAGRAGRHEKAGQVIIQTRTQDDPILDVPNHYSTFYRQEMGL